MTAKRPCCSFIQELCKRTRLFWRDVRRV